MPSVWAIGFNLAAPQAIEQAARSKTVLNLLGRPRGQHHVVDGACLHVVEEGLHRLLLREVDLRGAHRRRTPPNLNLGKECQGQRRPGKSTPKSDSALVFTPIILSRPLRPRAWRGPCPLSRLYPRPQPPPWPRPCPFLHVESTQAAQAAAKGRESTHLDMIAR